MVPEVTQDTEDMSTMQEPLLEQAKEKQKDRRRAVTSRRSIALMFFALMPSYVYVVTVGYGGYLMDILHIQSPISTYLGQSIGASVFGFIVAISSAITGLIAGRRFASSPQPAWEEKEAQAQAPSAATGYVVASPDEVLRAVGGPRRKEKPGAQALTKSPVTTSIQQPKPEPRFREYRPLKPAKPSIDLSTIPAEDLQEFGIASIKQEPAADGNMATLTFMDGTTKKAQFSSSISTYRDMAGVDLVAVYSLDEQQKRVRLRTLLEVVR